MHTCPKADDRAQTVSTSLHDDRGKDFPTQKAVLNACSKRIETLVAQHGKLIVHRATRHRQLRHIRTSTLECDKSYIYSKLHFKGPVSEMDTSAVSSPVRAAFSASPINTRRAASAASCLPCFLVLAHTAGNQRPPNLA